MGRERRGCQREGCLTKKVGNQPRNEGGVGVFPLENCAFSYKLLLLGHRSLIKKITQTAVINIVFQRIFKELDVSYASPHTFSKVTVTFFEN